MTTYPAAPLLPHHVHHCRPGDRHDTPIEAHLVDRLGTPWCGPDPTGSGLRRAFSLRDRLQITLGYGLLGDDRWLTTDSAKQKATIANAGVEAMAGVTVLSARGGALAWAACSSETRERLASVFEVSTDTIAELLRLTVCPHATPGCTGTCVMDQGQSKLGNNELTQLVRTLILLLDPEAYLELTYECLRRLADKHGAAAMRWRTNMADDVRWENVAPGLFSLRIPAIAYTKFAPCCRPERLDLGLRIVYSASERWSDDDILEVCAAGHTVAIVLDAPKHRLPATHLGLEVLDGDWHDDHHARPYGVILGLSAKANTAEVSVRLRNSGFARPVEDHEL